MTATLSTDALTTDTGSEVIRGVGAGSFELGSQEAGTINNVARDQYVSQRYELLIEPMRRRARFLLRLGNALIVSGMGATLLVSFLFASRIDEFVDSLRPAIDTGSTDRLAEPPFGVLLAIPLGVVAVFAGLVAVLFSVSMRRRAGREEGLL